MKNLLNCHCIGLHSFPLSLDNNLYRRVFYADHNHEMWKPFEIAVHPHHVDIKITVLDGELYNPIFEVNPNGMLFGKYHWNSHILNGKGGFEYLGSEYLSQISNIKYGVGQSVTMPACQMHTVQIQQGQMCVWLIEETIPTCDYFPVNYSPHDLTKWTPEGLYQEVGDNVKQKYIGKYL